MKKKKKRESSRRNPIAVAMAARHGAGGTKMRDRRERRAKERREGEEW